MILLTNLSSFLQDPLREMSVLLSPAWLLLPWGLLLHLIRFYLFIEGVMLKSVDSLLLFVFSFVVWGPRIKFRESELVVSSFTH